MTISEKTTCSSVTQCVGCLHALSSSSTMDVRIRGGLVVYRSAHIHINIRVTTSTTPVADLTAHLTREGGKDLAVT